MPRLLGTQPAGIQAGSSPVAWTGTHSFSQRLQVANFTGTAPNIVPSISGATSNTGIGFSALFSSLIVAGTGRLSATTTGASITGQFLVSAGISGGVAAIGTSLALSDTTTATDLIVSVNQSDITLPNLSSYNPSGSSRRKRWVIQDEYGLLGPGNYCRLHPYDDSGVSGQFGEVASYAYPLGASAYFELNTQYGVWVITPRFINPDTYGTTIGATHGWTVENQGTCL